MPMSTNSCALNSCGVTGACIMTWASITACARSSFESKWKWSAPSVTSASLTMSVSSAAP